MVKKYFLAVALLLAFVPIGTKADSYLHFSDHQIFFVVPGPDNRTIITHASPGSFNVSVDCYVNIGTVALGFIPYISINRDGFSYHYTCRTDGVGYSEPNVPEDLTFDVNNGFEITMTSPLGQYYVEYWITVEEIPPPTSTPTPEPVPNGCYVEDLNTGAATITELILSDASNDVYSWNGSSLWESAGPGSGIWQSLTQYGSMAHAANVAGGTLQSFRPSSLTPAADILVCAVQATPTPTATATVTGTPGPIYGTCGDGDFFCQYGEGTRINLSLDVAGPGYVTLTSEQASMLAEPGAWSVALNCTKDAGGAAPNAAMGIALRHSSASDAIWEQNNIFASSLYENALYTYHVPLPSLAYYDYALRSMRLGVSVGNNWGTDHATCSVEFLKVANNSVSYDAPNQAYKYDLYPGLAIWGNQQLLINSSQMTNTTVRASTMVDTDWNNIYYYGNSTLNKFFSTPHDTVALSSVYPSFSSASGLSWSADDTVYVDIEQSVAANHQWFWLDLGASTATSTPTSTATRTSTPTRTSTRTPTSTGTPTATGTPGPALSCVSSKEHLVPISPDTATVTLYNGAAFQVMDEPVYINIGGSPQLLSPSIYTWSGATGDYTFYSLIAPARVFACLPFDAATATRTPTGTPTGTATTQPTSVLPCPLKASYQVGAAPIGAAFTENQLYEVLDRPVEISVGGVWYQATGVGIWDLVSGTYQVRAPAGAARLVVCGSSSTATSTPTSTSTPTASSTATSTPTPICPVGWWVHSGPHDNAYAQYPVVHDRRLAVLTAGGPLQIQYANIGGNSGTATLTNIGDQSPSWEVMGTAYASPEGTQYYICSNEYRTPTSTATTTATSTATPGAEAQIVLSTNAASVGERGGALAVTVMLTAPISQAVSVDVNTLSVTAMAHSDFTFVHSTVTFAPGETSRQIAIPILDDTLVEGAEVFHVSLFDPRPAARGKGPGLALLAQLGDGVGLGSPATQAVTIIDDDGDPVPTIGAEVCVLVPPTTTAQITPMPTLPLALPTLRSLPVVALPSTSVISPLGTLIAGWAAPARTLTTWSDEAFAPIDSTPRALADVEQLTEPIGEAIGWLNLFTMLGMPLSLVIPALLIRFWTRIARGVLRLLRFIRIILPR